jgi:hypothetical protein
MNTDNTNTETETETYTRIFFVSTMGKFPNGNLGFNNFDIKTTGNHPTIKRCLEISNDIFPNLSNVILLSISELSLEDSDVFFSEQKL